jgi:hypothetical protein
MRPEDEVVCFQIGQIARAYPVKILNYHEIVNDVIGTNEIAVTHCSLAGSSVALDPHLDGKILTFDVAEVMYESTLVMRDRQTGTLWHQLKGEALQGKLRGRKLPMLPVTMDVWDKWQQNHPDGQVLSYLTGYSTNYVSNYWRIPSGMATNVDSPPGFPVTYLDTSRSPKEMVFGLLLGDQAMVLPEAELSLQTKASFAMGSRTVFVDYHPEGRTAFAYEEGPQGRQPVVITPCFWFAWKAAYWKSFLWKSDSPHSIAERKAL